MATEQFLERAVVLTWHVTYWDRLGWRDPFGHNRYVQRQRNYLRAWRSRRMYTPCLVVANRAIRKSQLQRVVQHAQALPATLAIDGDVTRAGVDLTAKVTIRKVGKAALEDTVKVYAVAYSRTNTTSIARGENRGKTLTEHFNVRGMSAPHDPQPGRELTFALKAPAGEKSGNLGVAILVEDTETMRTLECRAFPVTHAE